HGVVEAVRRTDRNHPLPDLTLTRIPNLHGRQAACVDLQHGDVGLLVGTDHLRLELTLVGELHGDDIRAVHHVRIGQNIAVRTDDKSRAQAGARLIRRISAVTAAALHSRHAAEEMLVELIEGIARIDRQLAAAKVAAITAVTAQRSVLDYVLRTDIDYGRAVGLDET